MKPLFFILILISTNILLAQKTNSIIRNGNALYNKQKYNNATEQYSKALQIDSKNTVAMFNQGDALFQLNQLDESKKMFDAVLQQNKDVKVKAKAFYNNGNIHYQQEKWQESVNAYKQSLKLNPTDKQAKYNLMMAMAKLKKDQQQQNKDKKDDKKQDPKNDKQDSKNQDKKDNPAQQNEPKNQQGNQGKQDQNQQPTAGKMTNEEAKNLLESLNNEEQKVQQKLMQKKGEPKKVKVEKDW